MSHKPQPKTAYDAWSDFHEAVARLGRAIRDSLPWTMDAFGRGWSEGYNRGWGDAMAQVNPPEEPE